MNYGSAVPGSHDKTVILWSLESLTVLNEISMPSAVSHMSVSGGAVSASMFVCLVFVCLCFCLLVCLFYLLLFFFCLALLFLESIFLRSIASYRVVVFIDRLLMTFREGLFSTNQ